MIRLVVALVICGWAQRAAPAAAQEPLFAPASPVITDPGSGDVLLADLDRDGHLDLVTRHLLGRTIAVRLGDGTGRYARDASSALRFDYQPGAATLGDVTGDGVLDLIVASKDSTSEKVHVFRGDGRGGFDEAAGRTFVASAAHKYYKPSVRVADVNEDGKPDIVSANGQRNTLEVLLGDGRGSFAPASVVGLEAGRGLYTSGVGDVDGDGHLDVVAVSSGWSGSGPGQVVTKRGDGRGGFADASAATTVPPAPRLVALADVNGDRRADVVLGHSGSGRLSILLSDGGGRFTPAAGSPIDLGTEAWAADVVDANADGRADLVVGLVNSTAAPYTSRVAVLLGDGQGFTRAPGSPFPAARGAYHVAVGDVNGDGRPDVAAASFESDTVTVLLGRGTRTSRR